MVMTQQNSYTIEESEQGRKERDSDGSVCYSGVEYTLYSSVLFHLSENFKKKKK